MSNISFESETVKIIDDKLIYVLSEMFSTKVIQASYQIKWLNGGTVGDVRLISGTAATEDGDKLPYKIVLKRQKKWTRRGDIDSWRREYDLYKSELSKVFSDTFRWPKCYHAQLNDDETEIWMEHVEGVSGQKLTIEMYEHVAEELGRFQGKLYAEKASILKNISNVSEVDFTKNYYLHYRSWKEVYDYVRSDNCEIPKHICRMLIDVDEKSDSIWERIKNLPIVFCHRDLWVENIFYSDNKIILIDWDTTGWGYMGEDIASLISDEADIDYMLDYYHRCIPAYYKGFSEYTDTLSLQLDNCVWELILVMFGYRLIEWYKFAKSKDDKQLHLSTLQKIYEMGVLSKKI